MGILLCVGILWSVTDFIHFNKEERKHLRIQQILPRIDFSVALFFLGILLAVDALEAFGVLKELAQFVRVTFTSESLFAAVLGVLSSIVDNVPLVAATIRMFGLEVYPQDHHVWHMLAFCVGVGGSILVIGSAPGIALMSLEKVSFSWYFKNMTWIAFVSYVIGTIVAAWL
jgi:Na+/H+ antiporter NhaD/arsenite permease-like protein